MNADEFQKIVKQAEEVLKKSTEGKAAKKSMLGKPVKSTTFFTTPVAPPAKILPKFQGPGILNKKGQQYEPHVHNMDATIVPSLGGGKEKYLLVQFKTQDAGMHIQILCQPLSAVPGLVLPGEVFRNYGASLYQKVEISYYKFLTMLWEDNYQSKFAYSLTSMGSKGATYVMAQVRTTESSLNKWQIYCPDHPLANTQYGLRFFTSGNTPLSDICLYLVKGQTK